MKTRYNATIKYNTNSKHPDIKNAKDLVFNDVYTIDTNYFYGDESIQDYIASDLKLVAGGGYDTKNIGHIRITIAKLN